MKIRKVLIVMLYIVMFATVFVVASPTAVDAQEFQKQTIYVDTSGIDVWAESPPAQLSMGTSFAVGDEGPAQLTEAYQQQRQPEIQRFPQEIPERVQGDIARWKVRLIKSDGLPAIGVWIYFKVEGANKGSQKAWTLAEGNGWVTFPYIGKNAGRDTITFTAEGITSTATTDWVKVWDPNVPLAWRPDFQKPAPAPANRPMITLPSGEQVRAAAALWSTFRMEEPKDTDIAVTPPEHEGGEFTVEARLKDVKIVAICAPSASWVDPNEQTNALLNHEQGHFSISEIFARLLKRQLMNLWAKGKGSTQKEAEDNARKNLHAAVIETHNKKKDEMRLNQEKYDKDTGHGTIPGAQSIWDKYIRDQLSTLPRTQSLATTPMLANVVALANDTDGDGIDDEYDWDDDNDLLWDEEELSLSTDPLNSDTDYDLLIDGLEVFGFNTDPKTSDTDGDGLSDPFEVLFLEFLDANPPTPVGGIIVPIDVPADKPATLLAPYIGLASTIMVTTAAIAIYVKRVKRRKKKQ